MKTMNAIIESISIDDGDRGLLTAWFHLKYSEGSGQGFGGFTLYLPKDYKHHSVKGDFAGHFIFRCMKIADVNSWDKVKGKSIRVIVNDGLVYKIGHIIKDDWFCPKEDFDKMRIE